MFSEKEFKLLAVLKETPFIKRENFASDEEFDFSCELARELLTNNVIVSSANKPFRRNLTGHGAQYAIAGPFSLSVIAREGVALESYSAYKNAQPRESQWGLSNRLVVWSIVAALLGTAVTIVVWRIGGI